MKSIVDLENLLVKPYIDTKDKAYAANIAPVETSPATSAHTAGTQIIYNGVLYDVTADIAANDVLTTTGVGANIAAADDVSKQISNVKQALTNETEVRAKLGAKNFIYPTANSQAVNGVVFTVNSDGTVLVNGTNSVANSWVIPIAANILLKKGSYILSGVPEGAYSSGSGCILVLINSSTLAGIATDYGSGAEFTLAEDTTVTLRFYVTASASISNKTFKPMIRLATDSDATYQPYAMTNKELTHLVDKAIKRVDYFSGNSKVAESNIGVDNDAIYLLVVGDSLTASSRGHGLYLVQRTGSNLTTTPIVQDTQNGNTCTITLNSTKIVVTNSVINYLICALYELV